VPIPTNEQSALFSEAIESCDPNASKQSELQAINELIKKDATSNGEVFRERRKKSKEIPGHELPTGGADQPPVKSLKPFAPTADEHAMINRLINESKQRPAQEVHRARRKSKELGDVAIPSPPPSAPPYPAAEKGLADQEDDVIARDPNARALIKAGIAREEVLQSVQGSLRPPAASKASATVVAGSPIVRSAERSPASSGRMALRRWKNAGIAVTVAPNAVPKVALDEVGDEENTQAKLYKLLSSGIGTENLSGAAARGARAAALSRIKAASSSVGGRFFSEEEWKAHKYEMNELRERNKRLEKKAAELQHQIREMEQAANRSHHGSNFLARLAVR